VLLGLAGLAMLLGHQRHGVPTAVFNAYLFNGLMAPRRRSPAPSSSIAPAAPAP
jgi:hypothetical protein